MYLVFYFGLCYILRVGEVIVSIKKFIVFISVIFMVFGGYYFYSYKVKDIDLIGTEFISYNEVDSTITMRLLRNSNIFINSYDCNVDGNKNSYVVSSSGNSCDVTLELSDTYKLYLTSNKGYKSNVIELNDVFNEVLYFKFNEDQVYLVVGEELDIEYTDVVVDLKPSYNFKSSDDSIVEVIDNKIVGKGVGSAYVYSDKVDGTINVTVTNLITKAYATKDKKTLLSCNVYTEEQAMELDNILEYKINRAGYQTRAGAVAAARFLTLEFSYRVPYFYENGRVPISSSDRSNINTHIADGEGRYYKKGLYLSNSKKDSIVASWKGPSIWGCNLMNLERNEKYGYYMGKLMPNGLDCSGFITWTLKNAGFDPGDVGAGEDPNRDGQCTDLGEFVKLNDNIDKLEVGDLLNWWGHIAMLIGIDGDTYYVAESLSYIGGVRAMFYSKSELINTFEYMVMMDSYYKNDGNLTRYWE